MSRSYNNNQAAAAGYQNYEEDENLAFLPADHVTFLYQSPSLTHFSSP